MLKKLKILLQIPGDDFFALTKSDLTVLVPRYEMHNLHPMVVSGWWYQDGGGGNDRVVAMMVLVMVVVMRVW